MHLALKDNLPWTGRCGISCFGWEISWPKKREHCKFHPHFPSSPCVCIAMLSFFTHRTSSNYDPDTVALPAASDNVPAEPRVTYQPLNTDSASYSRPSWHSPITNSICAISIWTTSFGIIVTALSITLTLPVICHICRFFKEREEEEDQRHRRLSRSNTTENVRHTGDDKFCLTTGQ